MGSAAAVDLDRSSIAKLHRRLQAKLAFSDAQLEHDLQMGRVDLRSQQWNFRSEQEPWALSTASTVAPTRTPLVGYGKLQEEPFLLCF